LDVELLADGADGHVLEQRRIPELLTPSTEDITTKVAKLRSARVTCKDGRRRWTKDTTPEGLATGACGAGKAGAGTATLLFAAKWVGNGSVGGILTVAAAVGTTLKCLSTTLTITLVETPDVQDCVVPVRPVPFNV